MTRQRVGELMTVAGLGIATVCFGLSLGIKLYLVFYYWK